jgi:hypothetical protein
VALPDDVVADAWDLEDRDRKDTARGGVQASIELLRTSALTAINSTSCAAPPYELERFCLRQCPAVSKRSQDCIEHHIQLLAHILSKKSQYEVAVLLKQSILPSVATIRCGIREMLRAIQFYCYARIGTQQVDFKCSEAVERDRQRHVEAETCLGLRQGFQAPVEERFCCTPSPVRAFGVCRRRPNGKDEEVRKRDVHSISNEPPHAARIIAMGVSP